MTILLHHYDSSPFSEKVRLCLGMKGLAWSSVVQPVIMPKPNLVALTGGYRRIPVMQIGADIWCDSVLIVRELERRFPQPSLFPAGDAGLGQASAQWTDRAMFQAAVTVIFAGIGDKVDPAFARDREALSGVPFDPGAMQAAVPHMAAQLRAHAALISDQLRDDRPFLTGAAAGLADANAYYNLWFVRAFHPHAAELFENLPGLAAWMARVAAIGHGDRSEATPAEAIETARIAHPDPQRVDARDEGLAGKPVTVSATDYGRDPIAGMLVGSSPHHLTIRREDPRVGTIHVHVPRLGFALSAAG